jgi:AraC-like DNA-binding protein
MTRKISTERSVKFWHVSELRNLELMHADRELHSLPRRLHEGFEISVVERGAEKLEYSGSTYIAPAGSVVVINPGEVYSARAVDRSGWTYRAFYPSAADVSDAASSATKKRLATPHFSTSVIQDKHVARILRQLHSFLEQPKSALALESFSIWVAAELVTRHGDMRPPIRAAGNEHRAVKLTLEFIHANFSENVTLTQISRLTGLSGFHLIHVFNQKVGLPPHAYLNQVRVNRARKLLSQGRSIAQVASETGFVDQSHLTRHFKRLLGVTPGQFCSAA